MSGILNDIESEIKLQKIKSTCGWLFVEWSHIRTVRLHLLALIKYGEQYKRLFSLYGRHLRYAKTYHLIQKKNSALEYLVCTCLSICSAIVYYCSYCVVYHLMDLFESSQIRGDTCATFSTCLSNPRYNFGISIIFFFSLKKN